MPKWIPYINHLAYAEDTTIFISANNYSLRLVKDTLSTYEKVSGQLTNKRKSVVYMHENAKEDVVDVVNRGTIIPKKSSLPHI